MNMHISFFAYLHNMKTEILFNFIRCQFFQPKLSQSRNMNVLLCVCCQNRRLVISCYGNRKVIFAIRNKFVLINSACLIALTINFEDLTPQVYDF